jgi:hypothetical protein
MRPHARRAILVAAILLLAGAALWWWPDAPTAEATPPLAANARAAAADASPEDRAVSAPVAAPAPRVELPADDAPLAGILRPLAERADAGDRKAACRLAMELLRCEHLGDYVATMAAARGPASGASDASPPNEAWDAWLAREAEWNAHWLDQCQAVPDALRGQGGRYLAQAARAGEPEAMVRYADGQHWPPSGRGSFAGPAFESWRRDAPGMMQRALESGYPGAIYALMIGYGDDLSPHAALIANDPEQALVMSLLYSRLYGAKEMRHYQDAVDAATQLRARERAGQIHQRHFNGRQFRGFPYPTAAFVPPQGDETTHGFCREP